MFSKGAQFECLLEMLCLISISLSPLALYTQLKTDFVKISCSFVRFLLSRVLLC